MPVQPEKVCSYVETYAEVTLGTSTTPKVEEHKVLGVLWNPGSDRLVIDVSELAQLASILQPTKRNLVSLIGKFSDPLGILAPVVVKFKILFQKLCQDKIDWESPLPDDLSQAIHLGIVLDLITEMFLRCLKRFAARRVLARKFISDNGKTLKGGGQVHRGSFQGRNSTGISCWTGKQMVIEHRACSMVGRCLLASGQIDQALLAKGGRPGQPYIHV